MLNKLKKLLMKKENNPPLTDPRDTGEEITNEEVFDQQIQAREESEAAADNIDSVPEPEIDLEGAEEFEPTEEEKSEMIEASSDPDPEYLEYSAEAVGYENREQQWDTYRIIANYISEGDSVIDFGAARGDFERFYQTELNEDLDYLGIEMNQQLVDASNNVYDGEVELICSDWFDLEKDLTRDWAININSSNIRYDADTVRDDKTYLQDTIKCMMNHSEKGCILLLASDMPGIDDGLISWNPGDIFNWAQKEFGMVAMDHTFSNDIFTLIIYKN